MKITVLIDNTPSDTLDLKNEHGLSFWIETDSGKKVLCDVGASNAFLMNAAKLGIDLNTADFCVLSHGHADHTGGLRGLMEQVSGKMVFMEKSIFKTSYFTYRHERKRDISTDRELYQQYPDQWKLVEQSGWITNEIALVKNHCTAYPQPLGNKHLTKMVHDAEQLDDFSHELALVVRTSKGLVIISSCSHHGAVNIAQSCCDFAEDQRVVAFIGGLHLVDSEHTQQETEGFAASWNVAYPSTRLITGHCTSDKAKIFLRDLIPGIEIFRTGSVLTL